MKSSSKEPLRGSQRSWRGVCGEEVGLALVVVVDDHPRYNMRSQVFF